MTRDHQTGPLDNSTARVDSTAGSSGSAGSGATGVNRRWRGSSSYGGVSRGSKGSFGGGGGGDVMGNGEEDDVGEGWGGGRGVRPSEDRGAGAGLERNVACDEGMRGGGGRDAGGEDSPVLILSVKDNGGGISPDHCSRCAPPQLRCAKSVLHYMCVLLLGMLLMWMCWWMLSVSLSLWCLVLYFCFAFLVCLRVCIRARTVFVVIMFCGVFFSCWDWFATRRTNPLMKNDEKRDCRGYDFRKI